MTCSRWWVALSGGLDSSVLLHTVGDWRRANPLTPAVQAIHVNHELSPEADEWQRHCETICRDLGIPLAIETVAVQPDGGGLEEAARRARYAVFERLLGPGDCLFMGHHLDDQVETFFLRLLRGAGLRGLAAMPPQRTLGQAHLVRPLLGVSRVELENVARERGFTWVDDPSNSDLELDRNYIRHELLPVIAARWPGYRQTIGRAIGHVDRAAALESHPPDTVWTITGDPGVRLTDLAGLDSNHIMRALRAWLAGRGLPMPAQAPLAEFTRQLQRLSAQSQPRMQWGGHVLQRYREGIFLLPAPAVFAPPAEGLSVSPGTPVRIAGVGDFRLVSEPDGGISLDEGESLRLGWRRGGERCRPQGHRHRRSLKKLLQNAGVPPWWRERLPLFYRGNRLVAVADLWCCDSSAATGTQARTGARWRLDWRRPSPPGGSPSPRRD